MHFLLCNSVSLSFSFFWIDLTEELRHRLSEGLLIYGIQIELQVATSVSNMYNTCAGSQIGTLVLSMKLDTMPS